jgi:hypothetical protein
MRSILLLVTLSVGISSCLAFDSKTWMHKGHRIHVAIGKKEQAAIGSYLVTVAGPGGKRATVRSDRDGMLVNAWAADLDRDGNFEVIVATKSAGGGRYGKVGIFTWSGAGLKEKECPELTKAQMTGYMGQDTFQVSRNNLHRTFPTFRQKGNDPARRSGSRTLRLNLSKFRWEAV